MGLSDENANERCMKIYKAEKIKVERFIIIVIKE